ncbi:hypothetical protein [Bartonella sp. HY761]|uniref:hypothetical protein n=1 Tax=Bartonella sp. HY761 TaxID=2979330 RepID=UPI00220FB9E2|nr:hypothetical protein [Bartonella sp. HY761]UXN07546.1 hypothetical protein N6A79_06050 [Bartonella sp. HY761]
MKKSIIAASICLLAMPIAAQAEELRTVSSLDYALNDDAYLGQTLKLSGCRISHVSTQSALCNISVDGSSAGNIYLELGKMDRTELKDAAIKCAGIKGFQNSDCDASIIGSAKPKGSKPKFEVDQIIWGDR